MTVRPVITFKLHIRALLILLVLFVSGCSRWTQIQDLSPTVDAPPSVPVAAFPPMSATIVEIRLTQNGTHMPVGSDLANHVLERLAQTDLFGQILYPAHTVSPSVPPATHATVLIDTQQDPHPGTAALKGIVIGASMFLLTPVLPLHYDYGARLTLELERPDGTTHRYQAHTHGTASYHLFGATPLILDELRTQVLDQGFRHLQQALIRDRDLAQTAAMAPSRQDFARPKRLPMPN